jgi:hypothetical protein
MKPLGEFPALERLSMSGNIIYIGAFVMCCPRLRVLRAKFRGVSALEVRWTLGYLKQVLGTREVLVSLLDVSISDTDRSLIRGAADLAPQELVYKNSRHADGWPHPSELFLFDRTVSIEINCPGTIFESPTLYSVEFFALERLCLLGCSIDNLGKFVSCCPRLRVLKVDSATSERDITVHSTSLQELVLGTYKECPAIDIVTPMLKQLTMEVHSRGDIAMSVSAPQVEKVSLRRSYTAGPTLVFGLWLLQGMSIETTTGSNGDGTCLQLSHAHVLTVDMCASVSPLSCSV